MLILYIATGAFLIGGGVLLSSGLVQQTSREESLLKNLHEVLRRYIPIPVANTPLTQPSSENNLP